MSYQGFLLLPADLLIEIFLRIPAFSRISLRRTCKALYDVSKNRTLWIHCLKKIIVECGLFGPSFQHDKMTSEQLEAAANMQLRFRCNLAQRRTSIENFPLSPLLPFDPLSAQFSLVPGGRFLVSFHENILSLWDLGIVGCGPVKPLVVATTTCALPPEKNPYVHVDFELESNDLFITVGGFRVRELYPTTTWCTIYKICPLDHSPTFSTIGQLYSNLFGASGARLFDPSKLITIFSSEDSIWLWHISQNTLISWIEGARISKMWIAGNGSLVVIPSPLWENGAFDEGSILELPQPFGSHSIGSPDCVRIEKPLIRTFSWRRPYEWGDASIYRFIDQPLASRYMTSSSTFDSIAYFHDKRAGESFNALAIVRYNLTPSRESSGDLTFNTMHEALFEGSMDIPFTPGIRDKKIGTHVEGIRLLYYKGAGFDNLMVHISTVSPDPHPTVEQHAQLCAIPILREYAHSTFLFSPETGRACVGKKEGLYVVDFGGNI